MNFVGVNHVKLNKETVERAITTWLNEGRYSGEKLEPVRFVRHDDGSMTVAFKPKSQFSEKHQKRLEAVGISTETPPQ